MFVLLLSQNPKSFPFTRARFLQEKIPNLTLSRFPEGEPEPNVLSPKLFDFIYSNFVRTKKKSSVVVWLVVVVVDFCCCSALGNL